MLSVSLAGGAQTGAIRGRVMDAKTREPLIGASVLVDGTGSGAVADLDGYFVIGNLVAGNSYVLKVSYVSYETMTLNGVAVTAGDDDALLEVLLMPAGIALQAVEVVAKANRESENILLLERRQALLATQTVGARELGRKGVGDARGAVAKVSGVSKQDGVKNVFVRGLGDRYNATLFNGFPIPSEDPEYKNIALDFFSTDIIQSVGVSKVFGAAGVGDVGGAVVDISSKELMNGRVLMLDVQGGANTETFGSDFLKQDGSGYWGFSDNRQPADGVFGFGNRLTPSVVGLPVGQHVGLVAGRRLLLGERQVPLTVFLVASHGIDYFATDEVVRNTYTNGHVYIDLTGKRYQTDIHQLVLGSVDFAPGGVSRLRYNFLMLHANNQYVGQYRGRNEDRYQAASEYGSEGFLMRQQTNDNLLFVHQVAGEWNLWRAVSVSAGASYNSVLGKEPDRRVNNLYKTSADTYALTGSNSQKRFFSTLRERDVNARVDLTYRWPARSEWLAKVGYNGRFVRDDFEAVEYDMSAVSGAIDPDALRLDDFYNAERLANGDFRLTRATPTDVYGVEKEINSVYGESTFGVGRGLTANAGVRADFVSLRVNHSVKGVAPGTEGIDRAFVLPSVNVKYDVNDKQALRLGLSKTYTLPQSKEITPYIYVSLNFNSQGNKELKPSDNYNADLTWDYYLSASELVSVTGFVKRIENPIARVEEGGSGGYLTYKNIARHASIAGVEVEVRKNIVSLGNAGQDGVNRLSAGFNASYIYSGLEVDVRNTEARWSALEGAAPVIVNADLSHTWMSGSRSFTNSVVLNYFSDRIYTIGTIGYNDIVENGVPTLDFVSMARLNQRFSIKLKAANLLNPDYVLTRQASSGSTGEKVVLSSYKKGATISVGVVCEF